MLMVSMIGLLIFLTSFFEGLMRHHVVLKWKFSLWSFKEINALDFANDSTQLSSPKYEANNFASLFIWLYRWL